MLENGALLLRPCAAFPGARPEGEAAALEPARAVLDALTGAPLGFAGWRRRPRLWPRWLARPVLAVHEGDDAPLLFTARRLWGLAARWEVRDADGHLLGVLSGPLVRDRFGRHLALYARPPEGVGRARDRDGRELMTLMATAGGTRVAFTAEADRNPFLKMLLLALALVGPCKARSKPLAEETTALTDNPWKRLARRAAYENPWITVWHDDVLRPDGRPGVYGVVHFRNRAVGVVALDEHDRVLLVGQYRYTLDAYSWELPEGGAPFDEDPLAAARRELLEETGYTAADWQPVLRAHLSNSVSDEEAVVYLARGLTAGTAAPEGTEQLQVKWLPFARALAMVEHGDITDAMSVMGLQRVALMRLGGG